jgi:thiamine-monophosphate kinase
VSHSEFDLIRSYFRDDAFAQQETELGNGDDASVHAIPSADALVVSVDSALCGRHWPEDFPLDMAAERAVGSALSDLAAMGAQARWLWLAISLEHHDQADAIGQGVRRAAQRYGVEIAGGDTTRGKQTMISVTVAGLLPHGTAMRRDRAQVGDAVYIAGALGRSSLGLAQWQHGEKNGVYVPDFADVKPLLEAGVALRESGVRCCMDVSDGLLQDARHICIASGCAMRLDVATHPGFLALSATHGRAAAACAMYTGGDDYALLFTAPASLPIPEGLAVRIGSCIAADQHDVTAYIAGEPWQSPSSGFDHFIGG